MNAAPALDLVAMAVFDGALTATGGDTGVTMIKTSCSAIFNESLDFSSAFDLPCERAG